MLSEQSGSIFGVYSWSGVRIWLFGFALDEQVLGEPLFTTAPAVVRRGEAPFLTWAQERYPYFLTPQHAVIDGRLVFSLSATSSTASSVTLRQLEIKDAESVEALKRGGTYWWQKGPSREAMLVPLRVTAD